MRRNQRTATIDYSFAVGFESVGRVVEAYAKEHLYEIVGQSFLPVTHDVAVIAELKQAWRLGQ